MFKILYAVIVVLSCMMPLFSVDKNGKNQISTNLDLISDDFKFGNVIQFVKIEKYDRALSEMREYLEIYPDGRHRYEIYSEIESIYFDNLNYLQAIKVNKKIYEEFGNSDRGVSAYYKIGICYNKMGYEDRAKKTFEKIIVEHPESLYAERAITQIELLSILKD